MKRSAALAVGLILILVAALAAGFIVRSECPDCAAAWIKYRRDAPLPGYENPGCPRCEDEGEVRLLSRWLRRRMNPDLARLFRACWDPSDHAPDVPPLLRVLGPDVPDESACEAFFVHTNEDPLVAVAHHPWAPDAHVWTLLLFDLDGALIDQLRIAYPGKHAERPSLWTTTSRLNLRVFSISRPGFKGLRFALSGPSGKRDVDGDVLRVGVVDRRFRPVAESRP